MAQRSAKRPDQYVAEQVRRAREGKRSTDTDKQWRQEDLVARLVELGYTNWRQSKVAKIERGDVKRLALDDVIALAAALGVQPAHLLVGDGDVEVAPKLTRSASDFRDWLRGTRPLADGEERFYFLGPLVPDEEAARILEAGRPAAQREAVIDALGAGQESPAQESTRGSGRPRARAKPRRERTTDG
jgi:transcriptional regulator with XRE-family HTH domain